MCTRVQRTERTCAANAHERDGVGRDGACAHACPCESVCGTVVTGGRRVRPMMEMKIYDLRAFL